MSLLRESRSPSELLLSNQKKMTEMIDWLISRIFIFWFPALWFPSAVCFPFDWGISLKTSLLCFFVWAQDANIHHSGLRWMSAGFEVTQIRCCSRIHVVLRRPEECARFFWLGFKCEAVWESRCLCWLLTGVGCCVETFRCVCGDNWSPPAPEGARWCEPLAAVWFDAERCVLFYHPQVLTVAKGGVTALLKPAPSSDLFVGLWGATQNKERFFYVLVEHVILFMFNNILMFLRFLGLHVVYFHFNAYSFLLCFTLYYIHLAQLLSKATDKKQCVLVRGRQTPAVCHVTSMLSLPWHTLQRLWPMHKGLYAFVSWGVSYCG